MITNVSIKNFKSIKYIDIACSRLNIFIGEPNTGKSNILEALGLISGIAFGIMDLQTIIRFRSFTNLFYDDSIDNNIEIEFETDSIITSELVFTGNLELKLVYENNHFLLNDDFGQRALATFDYDGIIQSLSPKGIDKFKFLKYFKFKKASLFNKTDNLDFLEPPFGDNLFSLVYNNKTHRKSMIEFFKDYKLQLVFRPQEKNFEVQKQQDDTIISYPYVLVPDTLKSIIFYYFAIASNKDSVLIFEEPEAHVFPYYTKFIAEKIAADTSNQYFIVTHNPYFLYSILEKAPKKSVNVFVTYSDNYQTKIKLLSENKIDKILNFDLDPFFNISSLI